MNGSSDRPDAHFAKAYQGEATSLRQVRSDVADWLRARGDDDDSIDRLVLIASELATNAVHASPGMPYDVLLRSIDPDHVELTIANPSLAAVLPPRSSWVPEDALAPRGRGLSIVAALSADVTVQVESDQVSVTARIRMTPPG